MYLMCIEKVITLFDAQIVPSLARGAYFSYLLLYNKPFQNVTG